MSAAAPLGSNRCLGLSRVASQPGVTKDSIKVIARVIPVLCFICFVTDPELAQTEQMNACCFHHCSKRLCSNRGTYLESRD